MSTDRPLHADIMDRERERARVTRSATKLQRIVVRSLVTIEYTGEKRHRAECAKTTAGRDAATATSPIVVVVVVVVPRHPRFPARCRLPIPTSSSIPGSLRTRTCSDVGDISSQLYAALRYTLYLQLTTTSYSVVHSTGMCDLSSGTYNNANGRCQVRSGRTSSLFLLSPHTTLRPQSRALTHAPHTTLRPHAHSLTLPSKR